ncbi:dihydrolipoyllysine-residue acetyltransferase [Endozoicomonas sp. SM1973]|uniref:Acetyltransferase component of pyruvate dehydrogenase complex n=1 Tax=Spartinivicinus marinus TaxID=2994442 RepID=A0A853I962_9GAMM|nr:dihydrolipoyllysine-residue acetyltransferase [Spartinivicinus marinus]MCX4026121.1 dihydrolipoyllysine-residue acetyltransferase [Spartinivicinus marinus]NYZ66604.1 dihydrolipoyllysine-residue acetyltransferase [Spartinivicinus marinus]
MSEEIIKVPDIGGSEDVEIIEVCVQAGDTVAEEDSLIVLESDKATMEIPCPKAGTIQKLLVQIGDKVSEGSEIVVLAAEGATEALAEPAPAAEETAAPAPTQQPAAQAPTASAIMPITVPDIGSENVPVIEVCVKEGDEIAEEDSIIVLESDKATMEVPAPKAGIVKSLKVKEGDTVSMGDLILELETTSAAVPAAEQSAAPAPTAAPAQPAQQASAPAKATAPQPQKPSTLDKPSQNVHAGPAVRKLAREFGVDLSLVKGSGPRSRILKEDVQAYVSEQLKKAKTQPAGAAGGAGIPEVPAIDFSQFGPVREEPMSRLRKVGGFNLHRAWLNVPHVTQFDEADITELEAFRKAQKAKGVKMTPLPFLVKACAQALRALPNFNASLNAAGDGLVYKDYVHIGIAVDTPDGLLVPVIRDADKKGLVELAKETIELAGKAKDKKLSPAEMQGACFTISSLGSIGGTAFTPIVNTPEVGILGVSKSSMKPVWNGKEFEPRLMLPLCLSYDHRAINGADAARFTAILSDLLSDIRQLLL